MQVYLGHDAAEAYAALSSTRKAIHVGDRPLGKQQAELSRKMFDDIMRSQKAELEFLLDKYRVRLKAICWIEWHFLKNFGVCFDSVLSGSRFVHCLRCK